MTDVPAATDPHAESTAAAIERRLKRLQAGRLRILSRRAKNAGRYLLYATAFGLVAGVLSAIYAVTEHIIPVWLLWSVGSLCGLCILGSLYYVLFKGTAYRSQNRTFEDIDIASMPYRTQALSNALMQVGDIKADKQEVEALIAQLREEAAMLPAISESFRGQMAAAVRVLEDKARVSDQKASALLDRGVSYSKFGIALFIISIVAWQFAAWTREDVGLPFFFGMASTTVLFVFIQFLSSWFLKQYRHFVEVSTYLIEIKSVFDRYALIYMLAQEAKDRESDKGAAAALVATLKAEMKWPRARPGFTKDAYYAKDTIASFDEMVKAIAARVNPKADDADE